MSSDDEWTMSRKRGADLDPSYLMDCPDEDCDGILMRINLPSEKGRYRCITCGLITWDTEEMKTDTMDVGQMITIQLDNWSWNE